MNLFDALFGCTCKKLSLPITRKGRCYRVCTDCGKEYEYDWSSMQIVRPAKCEAGRREEVVA